MNGVVETTCAPGVVEVGGMGVAEGGGRFCGCLEEGWGGCRPQHTLPKCPVFLHMLQVAL